MRMKRARVPYHSNTAGRDSRAVGGQWTTRSTGCCNRSFVASWSARGKRKGWGQCLKVCLMTTLADRVGEKKKPHETRARVPPDWFSGEENGSYDNIVL